MDRSPLGIVGIAALLRKDKGDVSRAAARGDYGKSTIRKGGKFKRYRVAAIEKAAGKKFSPEQVSLAAAAHDQQTPARPALLLDFASALLALRDHEWSKHLTMQGVTNFTPLPASNLKGSKT